MDTAARNSDSPPAQNEIAQGVSLKPCPFCGASLVFKRPRHGDDYHEHPKNECILAGDFFIADPLTLLDSADAATAWNRRASPPILPPAQRDSTAQCPACNGYGRVNDGSGARSPYGPKCPKCGGSGRVPASAGPSHGGEQR